uniref:Uncharacterized protein n=1 Tax=Parascaris univalens TaxID=6257 RepID=A0A915CHG7_PARUN
MREVCTYALCNAVGVSSEPGGVWRGNGGPPHVDGWRIDWPKSVIEEGPASSTFGSATIRGEYRVVWRVDEGGFGKRKLLRECSGVIGREVSDQREGTSCVVSLTMEEEAWVRTVEESRRCPLGISDWREKQRPMRRKVERVVPRVLRSLVRNGEAEVWPIKGQRYAQCGVSKRGTTGARLRIIARRLSRASRRARVEMVLCKISKEVCGARSERSLGGDKRRKKVVIVCGATAFCAVVRCRRLEEKEKIRREESPQSGMRLDVGAFGLHFGVSARRVQFRVGCDGVGPGESHRGIRREFFVSFAFVEATMPMADSEGLAAANERGAIVKRVSFMRGCFM